MALAQQLRPRQEMGVSPALVASVELLGLRPAELADAVARELDDNPALVLDERGQRRAGPHDSDERAVGDRGAGDRQGGDQRGEQADRLSDAARLLADLRLMTAASDHAVAEYVVGSLDERGYLDADPDEMADELGVARRRVDRVLTTLRACGPPGIAARDLRECLRLQLDRRGVADPILHRVIESHLPALAAGRYGAIAAALGVSRRDVVGARDYIRTHLRPSPCFAGGAPSERDPDADVIVSDGPEGLTIRLTEPERFPLRVCPVYAELAELGTVDERLHAGPRARRARDFASRVERRWDTMARIARFAVQAQAEFVRRGAGPRRPLTQADAAHALALHDSVVSRAIRDRHVRLPGGRVVPLCDLFCTADASREALRALLANEHRPLTDGQLAQALAARGHRVARRTVAKYRAQLGQPQRALR